jgi:hypothetical protein
MTKLGLRKKLIALYELSKFYSVEDDEDDDGEGEEEEGDEEEDEEDD